MKRTLLQVWLFAVALLVMAALPVYASADSSLKQVVNKAMPAVSVSGSASTITIEDKATFTAQLAGRGPAGPTGAVTFTAKDSRGNVIATSSPMPLDSQGRAGWTSGFQQGTYAVGASYKGDLNYLANLAASEVPLEVTGAADFSINTTTIAVLKQGQSGQSKISIIGLNGFTGTVQLSCSSTHPQVGCTLLNSAVSTSSTTEMTVTTQATIVKVASLGFLGIFALVGIGTREKRGKRLAALLILCALSLLMMAGCGTPRRYEQTDGTPPGTYKLTITGTSGNLTHKAVVQVIVQPQQ
jgi:hypothetical protein